MTQAVKAVEGFLVKPVRLSDIKINEEYKAQLRPFTKLEYDRLQNIRRHGIRDAIDLNQDMEVIDGYHRFEISGKEGFEYIDQFIIKHNGSKCKSILSNLRICYKSLLWLVKGECAKLTIAGLTHYNLIESSLPDKADHELAQSAVESEYIIEHILFAENQTVLDPFMGSGIKGIAALRQKRQFIGIEIDKARSEVAQANIGRAVREIGAV